MLLQLENTSSSTVVQTMLAELAITMDNNKFKNSVYCHSRYSSTWLNILAMFKLLKSNFARRTSDTLNW